MYLWSCDWGTSSFRLCLVDRRTGVVLGKRASDNGVKMIFAEWLRGAKKHERASFFLSCLQNEMELLQQELEEDFPEAPVLISGMAGSSIGIRELPYAQLPFSLRGETAVVEALETSGFLPNPVFLVSGVRSTDDVMRGEETQMIGLFGEGDPLQGICIQPGTHSKHIYLDDGKIVDFRTFMTGELFDVLCRNSILANSVKRPESWSTALEKAYRKGVARAADIPYAQHLFAVRTNALFEKLTPEENYYYLSGLHIGAELSAVNLAKATGAMVLCGGRRLSRLYRMAAEELGYPEGIVVVDEEEVEKAATRGQLRIFKKLIAI